MSKYELEAEVYSFNEQDEPKGVAVRLTTANGGIKKGILFNANHPQTAKRIVDSILNFAEVKTPSAVHWICSRLRDIPASERRMVLDILDEYVEGT